MMRAFFFGHQFPRFITHTNVVLLPTKEKTINFSDLKPVSLSTFANKVISRLLHQRITKLLPILISRYQFGFAKGRSQEILRDINIRKNFQNEVVKLDMAKTYNRVS